MMWEKIYNKGYDSKVTLNLRKILSKMFRRVESVDFDKIVFKKYIDYDKKRIILEFKKG